MSSPASPTSVLVIEFAYTAGEPFSPLRAQDIQLKRLLKVIQLGEPKPCSIADVHKAQDINSGIRHAAVTQRTRDPTGGVVCAPRFDPGADARLPRSDDLVGNAGADILPFCILHCLFLSLRRVSRDAGINRAGDMKGAVTVGQRQHGDANTAKRRPREGAGQPLTGTDACP
jgi:hypothetical protein